MAMEAWTKAVSVGQYVLSACAQGLQTTKVMVVIQIEAHVASLEAISLEYQVLLLAGSSLEDELS